ncbi:MAG: AraC family transcriptional regulator [Oscillospiraceae bacterium]|nr:AraC family transcriptional regulator [Oscillospiraceae bacterium]
MQENDKPIDLENIVSELSKIESCRVMRVANETGEGIMTIYPVFEGVYIIYDSFRMRECESSFHAQNILCIDHCREGRIETSAGKKGSCFLSEGDVRIDDGSHNNGRSFFPLDRYYGLTIGFEIGRAQKSIAAAMPALSVDLNSLAKKFCERGTPFVLAKEPGISHIFSELYAVPEKIRISYFRIKALELLLCLDALETAPLADDIPYFPSLQVGKIRAVHKLMTSSPEKFYTIDELSERFGISSAQLKKCFSGVYGSPIYSYMKSYRMNLAAEALKRDRSRKIGDIALSVGYENAGKFSAAFRSVMGRTPLEYRNSFRETEEKHNEK